MTRLHEILDRFTAGFTQLCFMSKNSTGFIFVGVSLLLETFFTAGEVATPRPRFVIIYNNTHFNFSTMI